jgi:hypothetical protein
VRTHRLLGVALCLVLFPLAAAHAQNLITNPRFDRDLSGWTIQQGSVVWSNQDAGGAAFSGSMDASPVGDQNAAARSNCFSASLGNYLFEFKHREPGEDTSGINAFVRWYSDTNCTTLLANSVSLNSTFHGPGWQRIGTNLSGIDVIAPPGTRSAALQLNAFSRSSVDDVVVARVGTCTSPVCLNNSRFGVDVSWSVPLGTGYGTPIDVTSDSVTYWFFGPGNIELVVKVLTACAVNDRYWVFMAGLTDVRVNVTITDIVADETWTYENPQGTPFPPVQDTSAFATCP